jgi:hypothetical protein
MRRNDTRFSARPPRGCIDFRVVPFVNPQNDPKTPAWFCRKMADAEAVENLAA